MQTNRRLLWAVRATAVALLVMGAAGSASATEPCGDFGECKALIEINAADGDVGFHFLADGDDLRGARIHDPDGVKIFQDRAYGPLAEQTLTETFAESAEPLCWNDPEADPDDDIVTLEDFLELWSAGTYLFSGISEGGEFSFGETELTYALPAAPADLDFIGGVITWSAGTDLGNCAAWDPSEGSGIPVDLFDLVPDTIPDPATVPLASWEVVMEPDVDDGDVTGTLVYSIRVSANPAEFDPAVGVTVPAEYLASLPDDTPVKIEVGAIGVDDNATFTEEDGFCVNEDEGCEDD